MSVDDRFRQQFTDLTRQREAQRAEAEPLHGGGGGGTSGGMEPRIARLESDMEHVKKAIERIDGKLGDLTALKVDVATLKERMTHLPTKTEMKDELGAKLRAYLAIAVSIIGVMIAAATLILRAAGK